MKLRWFASALMGFLFGCTVPTEEVGSSEHPVEVRAENLWAGSVTYTMERYGEPCGNARGLDDNAIGYGSWERQRASVRNVCFEVWRRGVTNVDSDEYWRQLDVQVHYRYRGTEEWKQAYVNSIGRRGNNRLYAWTLDVGLDPFFMSANVATIRAPFEILNETERSFVARADLEFYFSVNGHKLSSSTDQSFRVAYTEYGEKAQLREVAGPTVLGATVECAGGALRAGWGAGYNAIDVSDQKIADFFTAGFDGSKLYAMSLASSGTSPNRVVSFAMSSGTGTAPGELPHYYAGAAPSSAIAELRPEGTDKMTLMVKAWDRETKKVGALSWTFEGCRPMR
jgi:hypothetical protein